VDDTAIICAENTSFSRASTACALIAESSTYRGSLACEDF